MEDGLAPEQTAAPGFGVTIGDGEGMMLPCWCVGLDGAEYMSTRMEQPSFDIAEKLTSAFLRAALKAAVVNGQV